MAQADLSLELAAIWRRVGLLEESNRQKDSCIKDLLDRLDALERTHPGAPVQNVPLMPEDDQLVNDPISDNDEHQDITGSNHGSCAHGNLIPSSASSLEISECENALDDVGMLDNHSNMELDTMNYANNICRDVAIADNENPDSVTDASTAHNNEEDGEEDPITEYGLETIMEKFPPPVMNNLHHHQRVGAAFLYSVLHRNNGTIFGDALGLGKTLQVLSALYMFWTSSEHGIKNPRILIVSPSTVVSHWNDEVVKFNNWLSGFSPFPAPFLINATLSLTAREDVLKNWMDSGGLLIISYTMLRELLERKFVRKCLLGSSASPHALVLDEGHKICNTKTALYRVICQIQTYRRLVISGYPLQNHLTELYTLMSFTNPKLCKQLFKSKASFITLYEKVISGPRPVFAKNRAFVLYKLLRQNRLFFRRSSKFLQQHLPRKTELVIEVRFSELQRRLWSNFLANSSGADGIVAHCFATMLSDHPQVVRRQIESDGAGVPLEFLSQINCQQTNMEYSGKMVLLLSLIEQCRASGEKVVVFSRWINALSFIEEMISDYNKSARGSKTPLEVIRFDGSTSIPERKSLINDFNSATSKTDCFLISTLCGEGISLVAASRVIILDANWNPSIDFQAAYRVYRIGQTRPVFIYRFIMNDMFENLVFQRQLEKVEVTNWVVDNSSYEINNRLDTHWRQFVKEPARMDSIFGPTLINMSDFAMNDSITRSIVEQHSLKDDRCFSTAANQWIVSITEHSKLFEKIADTEQFCGLDSAMAFEELEFDQVYPKRAAPRDADLLDHLKRLAPSNTSRASPTPPSILTPTPSSCSLTALSSVEAPMGDAVLRESNYPSACFNFDSSDPDSDTDDSRMMSHDLKRSPVVLSCNMKIIAENDKPYSDHGPSPSNCLTIPSILSPSPLNNASSASDDLLPSKTAPISCLTPRPRLSQQQPASRSILAEFGSAPGYSFTYEAAGDINEGSTDTPFTNQVKCSNVSQEPISKGSDLISNKSSLPVSVSDDEDSGWTPAIMTKSHLMTIEGPSLEHKFVSRFPSNSPVKPFRRAEDDTRPHCCQPSSFPVSYDPQRSQAQRSVSLQNRFADRQPTFNGVNGHGKYKRQLEALKNPDHFGRIARERKRLHSDNQRPSDASNHPNNQVHSQRRTYLQHSASQNKIVHNSNRSSHGRHEPRRDNRHRTSLHVPPESRYQSKRRPSSHSIRSTERDGTPYPSPSQHSRF